MGCAASLKNLNHLKHCYLFSSARKPTPRIWDQDPLWLGLSFCFSPRDSLWEELRRCSGSGNSQNKCQETCILAFPFWCVNNLVSPGISFPICKTRVCRTACWWWWWCRHQSLLSKGALCVIPGCKRRRRGPRPLSPLLTSQASILVKPSMNTG